MSTNVNAPAFDLESLKAQMAQLAAMQAQIAAQQAAMATMRDAAVATLRNSIMEKVIDLNNVIQEFNAISDTTMELVPQRAERTKGVKVKGQSAGFIMHCDVCNLDGHDKRSHRHCTDPSKPFTAEELAARGFASKPSEPVAPEAPAEQPEQPEVTAEPVAEPVAA